MCSNLRSDLSAKSNLLLPDDALARAAMEVVDRLRAAGHQAYPVGGCVRDLVSKRPPKDWDIATSALPDDVRLVFGRVIEVGAAFGVLRVPVHADGQRFEVEVATFRADGPYSDGRHPDAVRFTGAREDVLRRDFTLNGLLLDPGLADAQGRRYGRVLDWVGGQEDLRAGLLRAIGRADDRFAEDSLRILRAVRFAARFGLRLEARTRRALIHNAPGLATVSRERIRGELEGALRLPWAVKSVQLLGELELHGLIWPALAAVDTRLERACQRMEALCGLLMSAVDRTELPAAAALLPVEVDLDLPLALAALLYDIRPSDRRGVAALARDIRLSGTDAGRLGQIWALSAEIQAQLRRSHLKPEREPLRIAGDAAWIRLLRQREGDAALLLLASEASGQQSDAHGSALALRQIRAAADPTAWHPVPFLDGQTLRDLGHLPSPAFKDALMAAENVQLSGGDRQQALVAALGCLPPANQRS